MGRGKSLTVAEKIKIETLGDIGFSYREIAEKIGRSSTVVCHFIKNQSNYGTNMKGRTKKATTDTERRAIIRAASNSHHSAAKIKANLSINASVSTVKRVIKSAKHLKRMKLKKKPPLNSVRKDARLLFARNTMTWNDKWYSVVFSDEKKFNLEGPDGYNYYFHDLRKEEHFINRLHSREGGVMVWGAISYYGTCELQILTSRMNPKAYNGVLEKAFPYFKNLFGPLEWTYQQDNAPIHTARTVKSWIKDQGVTLLGWPPYSPDLNIIENVWGWLVRRVYESGRQFEDKDSLTTAIKSAWSEISLNYIKALYDSMPNRIFEVIKNKGGFTHY